MNLTGIISDSKETLVGASIFVSDKNGKIIIPTNGSTTDITGTYTLMGLNPSNYVTFSFIGYGTVTKKVSDLGSGSTVTYNITMKPKTTELEEFAVIEYKNEQLDSAKKGRNYEPYIYTGIVISALLGGYLIYKKIS